MKIKFLTNTYDKYTGEQYKKGQVKDFEDKRAKEILSAKQPNGQPYAEEVKEEVVEVAKKEVKTEKNWVDNYFFTKNIFASLLNF